MHLVAPDRNDSDPNVVSNDDLFIDFTGQDQHGSTSLHTNVTANSMFDL